MTGDRVYDWLSHPMVLLLVGAVVSSYLIPALTRRWQDHQKELEIKIDLVGQITRSVTGIVMAVQYAELGARSQTQEDFDAAYRDWEIESAVVGSRLKAYFPGSQIGSDWDRFAEFVTLFYALTGVPVPDERRGSIRNLQRKMRDGFPAGASSINWDALADKSVYPSGEGSERAYRERQMEAHRRYAESWEQLKGQVLAWRDALLQRILNARISGF